MVTKGIEISMEDLPATPEIATSDLFKKVKVGTLTIPNRIVMAPLTRSRALKGDIQGPLNAEYYAQRATAGLIISEATQNMPMAATFLRNYGM